MRSQFFYTIAYFSAIVFVIIDRLLKSIALTFWQTNPKIISADLSLIFSKNTFIAFSLPTFFNPLFLIIPIIVLLLVFFIRCLKNNLLYEGAGLLLILLGAGSNLYDRLRYSYVIDYINLRYFTVFNIADAMICLGALFLIILYQKK